ncbi:zinc finger domain-containing protein [Kitasatospora cheerisanensis]|uniref:DNA-binding phage zinc finger domain-containing protein n=1 Tax=Kitasatospora cheerisanensis KCTC 2395 TaxID=1348663 RepID=A0A066YZT9_9ACTN|nr:hypothetical protein [Kitasatospora cheerisanensis]KDN86722.1 hypothetical protein KCH_15100 [Kitasatospora cheerisanensis KCTC 2395]
MNRSETALLLALCASYDRRTVGEADVRAWQLVLADVDHQQAEAAVVAHYGDTRDWIMPADIKRRVAAHRADAARDIQGPGQAAEVPDADPDNIPAYLAALRTQRTRGAEGGALKQRPVLALLAGVGQPVPTELAAVRRPGALGVRCDTCKAAIGRPCKTPSQKPRAPHSARRTAVRAA